MDYSSNINLSKDNCSRLQSVYASQLYGTFFGIFAKFTTKRKSASELLIKKIDFSLINYKGMINLEIAGFENGGRCSGSDKDFRVDGLKLTILVKHTARSKPIQKKKTYDIKKVLKIEGILVKKGEYFHIMRKLLPINDPLKNRTQNYKKSFSHGVFDSEFYSRDGNYINCIPPFHYEETARIDSSIPHETLPDLGENHYDERCQKNQEEKMMFPSPRCIPAYNKIHF